MSGPPIPTPVNVTLSIVVAWLGGIAFGAALASIWHRTRGGR